MPTNERVSMREAQAILGVSKNKMWRLVKEGVLTAIENPLDKREKLVRRAEIERLRRYAKAGAGQERLTERKSLTSRIRQEARQ